MSFSIDNICYIVAHCHEYSQLDDGTEYCPVEYAKGIKVLQVKVIAADAVPVLRNGNTRMEYKIEAVDQWRHKYHVLATASGPSFRRVWYSNSLYPTVELAELERQKRLNQHLKETKATFDEQLKEIEKLIEN